MTLELNFTDGSTKMVFDVREFIYFSSDNTLIYWIGTCNTAKTFLFVITIKCKK
jgi:hypothetical protein